MAAKKKGRRRVVKRKPTNKIVWPVDHTLDTSLLGLPGSTLPPVPITVDPKNDLPRDTLADRLVAGAE